jgi:hypothetical protein
MEQIAVPHPRIELFKNSPLYSIPTTWNLLDERNSKVTKTILYKRQTLE